MATLLPPANRPGPCPVLTHGPLGPSGSMGHAGCSRAAQAHEHPNGASPAPRRNGGSMRFRKGFQHFMNHGAPANGCCGPPCCEHATSCPPGARCTVPVGSACLHLLSDDCREKIRAGTRGQGFCTLLLTSTLFHLRLQHGGALLAQVEWTGHLVHGASHAPCLAKPPVNLEP